MIDIIKFDTLKDGPARKKISTTALYKQSKFAVLVYATELARRYNDQGIVSVPLDPGSIKSDLGRHVKNLVQRAVMVCLLHFQ
jgi:retinol dehydrogenase 12